jgi:hypothetical protein
MENISSEPPQGPDPGSRIHAGKTHSSKASETVSTWVLKFCVQAPGPPKYVGLTSAAHPVPIEAVFAHPPLPILTVAMLPLPTTVVARHRRQRARHYRRST